MIGELRGRRRTSLSLLPNLPGYIPRFTLEGAAVTSQPFSVGTLSQTVGREHTFEHEKHLDHWFIVA